MNRKSRYALTTAILLCCLCGQAWSTDTVLAEIDVTPDTRIALKLDHGSISIESHELDQVQISSNLAAPTFELRVDGQAVEVDSSALGQDDAAHPALSIRLPRWSTLTVETISAEVYVQGIAGPLLRVSTDHGPVRISDARPARLEVRTVNGNQVIHGGGRSTSRLESIRGNIEARNLNGSVQISTHDGAVDVVEGQIEALEITTVSGRLNSQVNPLANGLIEISSHDSDIELSLPASAPLDAQLYSHQGVVASEFESLDNDGDVSRVIQGDGSVRAEVLSFSGDIKLLARGEEAQPTVQVLVFRREHGQDRFANFGFDNEVAVSLEKGDYALVSIPRSASSLFARANTGNLREGYGYSVLEVESWGTELNCFEIRPDHSDTSAAMLMENRGRVFQFARQFELLHVGCPAPEALADLRDITPQN